MKLNKNWKIVFATFALIAAFGGKAFAQAGGSAVPFLLISPDARASGMGETGTAIADDCNAVFWNPAGLAFHDYFVYDPESIENTKPYRQVSLAFSRWLPQFNADLYYSYGTFAQYFDQLDGTVALNLIFMNLGEFTRTDISGKVLGKFISNEFSVGLAYGTMLNNDLGIGLQIKYIQSNLTPTSVGEQNAGTGISAAFDFGVLYRPEYLEVFGLNMDDMISLGFNLQNVGPKMTYINEADPLPTSLRLGAAVTAFRDEFNDLRFAADVSKLLVKRDSIDSDPLPKSLVTGWENPGAEFALGMEYWYSGIIALRAGYFTEPAAIGNRKYWNFGAGVRYDIFRADFSFINTLEENHPLANTMRFTLMIDWQ